MTQSEELQQALRDQALQEHETDEANHANQVLEASEVPKVIVAAPLVAASPASAQPEPEPEKVPAVVVERLLPLETFASMKSRKSSALTSFAVWAKANKLKPATTKEWDERLRNWLARPIR